MGDIAMMMEDSQETDQEGGQGNDKKKKPKDRKNIQLKTGKRFKQKNADGGTRGRQLLKQLSIVTEMNNNRGLSLKIQNSSDSMFDNKLPDNKNSLLTIDNLHHGVDKNTA